MRDFRFIVTMTLLLSPTIALAADPFSGRWSLDPKRSKYPVGDCPKRMTIDMTETEHGVRYHSETQFVNGRSSSADYSANYDEKPVFVTGDRGMLLPVSLKRVGPHIVVATYMNGFQIAATSRRVVSANGDLMTVTTISRSAAGKAVTHVGVYVRRSLSSTGKFDLSKVRTNLTISK